MTSTCGGLVLFCHSFALCATPNRCCSSTTAMPSRANLTLSSITACVPTRMSIFPAARSSRMEFLFFRSTFHHFEPLFYHSGLILDYFLCFDKYNPSFFLKLFFFFSFDRLPGAQKKRHAGNLHRTFLSQLAIFFSFYLVYFLSCLLSILFSFWLVYFLSRLLSDYFTCCLLYFLFFTSQVFTRSGFHLLVPVPRRSSFSAAQAL